MIGLDTNVLARYYVDDATDAQAQRQRIAAQRLIESGKPLKIAKTVLLELEWVLRGFYGFAPKEIGSVFAHLLAMPQVQVEGRADVEMAISHYRVELDFADALHHASYGDCRSMSSFDDRRLAHRAKKMGLIPVVSIPT